VTIVEPFTKWAEALPVPNKEAATVARVLVEQFFCRFGIGIALLSDRGKEVDGNLMHEICRLLNIDKQHTTSYHSQCNAQCERLHRTLNAIIGRMLDTSERDWDMLLPYVMAAYRASRHEATGFTPNYLMLGRELRTRVDLIYGTLPQEVPATYDDYAEEVADRMRTAYSIVRDSLKRSAERNKLYYNLRVKPKQYQPGNWVYYYNPRKFKGKQEKWQRKYSGPFLVEKTVGEVNVIIRKNKNAKPMCVHIDKLKPYTAEDTPQSWLQLQEAGHEAPVLEEQQENLEVENQGETTTDVKRREPSPLAPILSEESAKITDEAQCDQAMPGDYAVAGMPPANFRTPRPRRERRVPVRFRQ